MVVAVAPLFDNGDSDQCVVDTEEAVTVAGRGTDRDLATRDVTKRVFVTDVTVEGEGRLIRETGFVTLISSKACPPYDPISKDLDEFMPYS